MGDTSRTFRIVVANEGRGLWFSEEAREWLRQQGVDDPRNLPRHDPRLVAVVEKLGDRAGQRDNMRRRPIIHELRGRRYAILPLEDPAFEFVLEPDDIKWSSAE